MRRFIVSLLVAFLGMTSVAHAAPVAAFTASTQTPVAGVPVAFTSSSDCVTNRCQWSWTYRTSGGSTLNGGQIGEGAVVTYAFPASAVSKPYVTVKLKVTAPGGTNNYSLATASYKVTN